MATITKFPSSVSQTTGGSYRTFNNLNNITYIASLAYATSSGNIMGKNSSPNRPSSVSSTNYGFQLPEGAEVISVTVQYNHRKYAVDGNVCNIPAPTISLLGVSGFSAKGVAPTTSFVESSKKFTGSALTRSVINSTGFGFKIDYPANTNSYKGTMAIGYVRIIVEYKMPSYSLTLKKRDGGYNEEPYTIEASISNTNLTSYDPTCTLTVPEGFSFTGFNGAGSYAIVDESTITWDPQLNSKTSSSTSQFTFDTDVTYPTGQTSFTGDFTLVESLYSGSKTLSATIRDRPEGEGEDEEDHTPVISDDDNILAPTSWDILSVGDEILVDLDLSQFEQTTIPVFSFPCTDNGTPVLSGADTPVKYSTDGTNWSKVTTYTNTKYTGYTPNRSNLNTLKFKGESVGRYVIFLYDDPCSTGYYDEMSSYVPKIVYFFEVKPDKASLSVPNFSVLEVTGEELDRLGDGYKYIAQSYIKHITTDTYTRDWYKNNRIGIHNNEATIFNDYGITNNYTDWYNNGNRATITRDDTGTKFYYETLNSNGNITLQARPSNTEYGITSSNFVVEFDIIEMSDDRNQRIQIGNSSSQVNLYLYSSRGFSSGQHIKFEVINQTITTYIDGVQTGDIYSFTGTGNTRVIYQAFTVGDYLKFKNFRIYTPNPTSQEIFDTAEYWSKATGGLNTYENCEVEFVYDEDYPLYVLMTGDYPEATSYGYDMGTIKHTEPCIIEEEVYNSYEPNGTYPTPITALLDSGDISTLELSPNQTSQGVVLYDFPVDETVSTNDTLAIRGFQVRAGLDYTDDLAIQAQLHSPTGEVGNRSILVDSQDEEIVIGGLGDLWGFTTLQMQHLGLWELELSVANILNNSDATIIFNNIEIIFYLETVEKQEITIKVEDEDIAYYGAFIETVKIPEGLNTDTSFLSIDGTDTNDAYRQNIREKSIEIEFNLSNCELQTSTDMLRQLTKLFVNEKDQYNRPIPKRIQFSHYPNDYFEYIMEEPFDVDTEITDYTIKAQLTVPSGTSYSLYDTITNTTGNANGLAAINPIITVRPSDVNIQITENNTDQTFNLTYTGDWYDRTVEIDCEDRKVYIVVDEDTRIDISKYVDYNSDWFRLDGEYDFSSVNCTILSVIFTERW